MGGVLGEAVDQVELAGERRQLLVLSGGTAGRCGRCAGERDGQRHGQGRHTAAGGRRLLRGVITPFHSRLMAGCCGVSLVCRKQSELVVYRNFLWSTGALGAGGGWRYRK